MQNPILPRPTDELPRYGGHGSKETGKASIAERFSHLVVGVTNLDRSEAWYRDVVGLVVQGRNLTAEERPHSVLAMNSGQLVILVEIDEKVFQRPARNSRHQAFLVTPNAYRRAYDRLKNMDFDIADTHEGHRALGNYSIDIMDPDGHRYQIQTYGPEAHEPIIPKIGAVDCGPASSFKVGTAKAFSNGEFYLVRRNEGFLAISRWCTHMNGRVVYQGAHWHFYCPFHHATYDCRGIPEPYPGNRAGGPLRLHPISFSDKGHVLVNTDEIIERGAWDPKQAVPEPDSASLKAAGGNGGVKRRTKKVGTVAPRKGHAQGR